MGNFLNWSRRFELILTTLFIAVLAAFVMPALIEHGRRAVEIVLG